MEEITEEQKISKQKESTDKSSFFFFGLFSFFLVLSDQLSKHASHEVYKNYAFAFSLPIPSWIMYFIYTAVLAVLIDFVLKNGRGFTFFVKMAWTLIFAGAFSNIAERIIFGYVKDFIFITVLTWTGVYNFADGFIIVGIIILLSQPLKVGDSKSELGIRN